MLNQLRLRQGASEAHFTQATGLDLDVIAPALSKLRGKGLMEPGRLQTTELGWQYLNDVLQAFLED